MDALCVKYSSRSSGLIIYDDRLKDNIIGELTVDAFRKIYQTRKPLVRRQYTEVHDIDQVSYRSLTHNTRIGDKYIPIVARIIPGIELPLIMGRDFRDDHAETPVQQKQVNELNHPRIYFFKRDKTSKPRLTLKQLERIHKKGNHPALMEMTQDITRLGHKIDKAMELKISRVIQECQLCLHKNRLFPHSQGQTYSSSFNTDVMVRRELVNDEYYTHLVTVECMDTGYTVARYVNKHRYDTKYEMLNEVVLNLWVYGETGMGYGCPKNTFFTPESRDNIQKLRIEGRKHSLNWAYLDLNPGKFQFLDCLDMTENLPCNRRLGEKVFIVNNLVKSDTGYTPQQLVYGTTSGLPGLFEIPRNPNSEFARSLHRLIKGIQGTDVRAAPTPLGMDFPYEPGDKVHFLGPKGRIGHGRILTKSGENYRIAHSGTRISSSINKCMAPTLTTRQNYSRRIALSPHLNTIVCREQKRVKFQLGTKRALIRN